MTTPGG
ncbi:hypothetical protein NQ315_002646 [Exocentrus adspersus]|nr:hypothetical protein NQ315_002646 [Exocentrus adspersus]